MLAAAIEPRARIRIADGSQHARRVLERNTSQSYRPPGGASTDGLGRAAGAESRGGHASFRRSRSGYVNDFASVIDAAASARMDDSLIAAAPGGHRRGDRRGHAADDRRHEDEAEVALAIGRKWGVGANAEIGDQRRNAGMVVLLVPRQNHEPGTGHIRIEVGQGLEGIVTDAGAGRIRATSCGPMLAREEYGPALTTAVASPRLAHRARHRGHRHDAHNAPSARARSGPGARRSGSLLPFLLLFLFFIIASRGFGGRARRRRVYWGGPWIGGGLVGASVAAGGGGGGGGGFGGFGGGGGFSGGGAGGRF